MTSILEDILFIKEKADEILNAKERAEIERINRYVDSCPLPLTDGTYKDRLTGLVNESVTSDPEFDPTTGQTS